ncbi:MAG: CDP-diacylglycerol--glycerol-3-phosphate 3-phosphatidyltransferase [Pseudomonadota bacterium]
MVNEQRAGMSLPMALTWARMGLVPVCVFLFYLPLPWGRAAAAGVFVLAGLTDWLDGYLARRWQQTSAFGAFLDPVADKVMVAVTLVLVVQGAAGGTVALLTALAAMAIIARELMVSALREWMATRGARDEVAVSWLGKLKTAAQMVSLTLLLYGGPMLGLDSRTIGLPVLLLATVLAYASMAGYVGAARRAG